MTEILPNGETYLRRENSEEASDVLKKIAEFPPWTQEIALAFLRGYQCGLNVRPNA